MINRHPRSYHCNHVTTDKKPLGRFRSQGNDSAIKSFQQADIPRLRVGCLYFVCEGFTVAPTNNRLDI